MVVGGERKKIRGDLIFAVCDTPAAAFLSGFKESSFAFKSCRMCNMTGQEMKQSFFPHNFNLMTGQHMNNSVMFCMIID